MRSGTIAFVLTLIFTLVAAYFTKPFTPAEAMIIYFLVLISVKLDRFPRS